MTSASSVCSSGTSFPASCMRPSGDSGVRGTHTISLLLRSYSRKVDGSGSVNGCSISSSGRPWPSTCRSQMRRTSPTTAPSSTLFWACATDRCPNRRPESSAVTLTYITTCVSVCQCCIKPALQVNAHHTYLQIFINFHFCLYLLA